LIESPQSFLTSEDSTVHRIGFEDSSGLGLDRRASEKLSAAFCVLSRTLGSIGPSAALLSDSYLGSEKHNKIIADKLTLKLQGMAHMSLGTDLIKSLSKNLK
jgi:hypothetical protein